MLVLLLRIGERRFGLDARDVVEVVPYVPLLPVPQAPVWIAGLLRHRDEVVPVVDLVQLVGGAAASPVLSTRIVILQRGESASDGLIGLLAEGVTETIRLDAARLRQAGLRGAPWLGPVALDDGGTLQLVRWTDLVPADLRAAVLEGAA